jgi:predicted transcriptional regulator
MDKAITFMIDDETDELLTAVARQLERKRADTLRVLIREKARALEGADLQTASKAKTPKGGRHV